MRGDKNLKGEAKIKCGTLRPPFRDPPHQATTKPYPPPCENPIFSTSMSMPHQICSLSIIPIIFTLSNSTSLLEENTKPMNVPFAVAIPYRPPLIRNLSHTRISIDRAGDMLFHNRKDQRYFFILLFLYTVNVIEHQSDGSLVIRLSTTTAHMGSAIVHLAGSALQNRHPSHLTSENQ